MSVSLTYRILGSFMVKPTKLERIIFTVMMTMHKVRTKIYLSMTHKFWDSFQKILDDKPEFLMVKQLPFQLTGTFTQPRQNIEHRRVSRPLRRMTPTHLDHPIPSSHEPIDYHAPPLHA